MPKFRIHSRPVTVDAPNKIQAMAQGLHFLDDNPSYLLAEEAAANEKISQPDNSFPIAYPRRR